MNTVEPIRDFDLILDMQDYLFGKKNKRDYVLFMFGIYSGLRISDILPLKVRDVRNAKYIYISLLISMLRLLSIKISLMH